LASQSIRFGGCQIFTRHFENFAVELAGRQGDSASKIWEETSTRFDLRRGVAPSILARYNRRGQSIEGGDASQGVAAPAPAF
jgi:hypothetical protein